MTDQFVGLPVNGGEGFFKVAGTSEIPQMQRGAKKASLEKRLAAAEQAIKELTWFTAIQQKALETIIAEKAKAELEPLMRAQLDAEIKARLAQGIEISS